MGFCTQWPYQNGLKDDKRRPGPCGERVGVVITGVKDGKLL